VVALRSLSITLPAGCKDTKIDHRVWRPVAVVITAVVFKGMLQSLPAFPLNLLQVSHLLSYGLSKISSPASDDSSLIRGSADNSSEVQQQLGQKGQLFATMVLSSEHYKQAFMKLLAQLTASSSDVASRVWDAAGICSNAEKLLKGAGGREQVMKRFLAGGMAEALLGYVAWRLEHQEVRRSAVVMPACLVKLPSILTSAAL
jgi:hypothetical protein